MRTAPRKLGCAAPVVFALGLLGAGDAGAQCLRFGAPRLLGAFESVEIVESSGLATSVHQPGVRFTHNDSGDGPRLFAFDAAGADLGAFEVLGATHRDWEDLALGPCALAPACLFVGDIGDNARVWESITVYRLAEPEVGAANAGQPASAIELTYPDGPRDAEALLVDPQTGDLFVVEKTEAIRARVSVVRDAGTIAAGEHALAAVGVVEVVGFVTGGDFDPTGREIVLRTYGGEATRWLARRDEGRVVSFDPLDAPAIDALGEAIAYRADGLGLLTTREAEGAPLYETPCLNPEGDTAGPAVGPLVQTPEPPEPSGCGGGSQSALLFLPLLFVGRRRLRGAALVALLVLTPSMARAEVEHEMYGVLAGGVWPAPNAGGHGLVLFEWRARRAPGQGTFTLNYNTDTLRLRYDDVCFGRVCLGAELAGQALFAGLLPDYYLRGDRVESAGLDASYLAGSLFAELRLPQRWFLRYAGTGRKWFFGEYEASPGASAQLGRLDAPEAAFVFESDLALTYWQLEPDRSQWEAHRLLSRVRGLALGVRGALHVRASVRPWGYSTSLIRRSMDQTALFPRYDDRNDPSRVILLVRQWARYGAQVTDRLRLQLEQRFAWGRGEDDLTRDRIGGLNPYVVPLGGVPWAAFLSGRYVAGRMSAHLRAFADVEVGAFFDAVTMQGIFRDGSARFGGAVGTGAFVDARFGDWQLDGWLAWAPGLRWGRDRHYVAGFLSLGARLW